jgi:MYXO-CTERM domain-containing protein
MRLSSNAISALFLMALVGVTSTDASARAGGHAGATGRDNAGGRCNRCHSPDMYDGAEIVLEPKYQRDCYVREGGVWTLDNTFFVVPYETEVDVTLLAALPPVGAPDNPNTPANDRTIGLYCPEGTTCGAPVAGFAIEVEGIPLPQGNNDPVLVAVGGDTKQAQALPGDLPSRVEVNHSAPRAFNGNEVSWTLKLKTPSRTGSPPQQIRLWAGVNACNANGGADLGDITSYTNRYVYFELPNNRSTAPSMTCTVAPNCAAGQVLDANLQCGCPEGQSLVEGTCTEDAACGCDSTATSERDARSGLLALATLFVLALPRRRRR